MSTAIICSLLLVGEAATVEYNVHDCYKVEDNGYSYRGLADFGNSGRVCQNWLDVGKISPVGDNGIGGHNYCRNPDQSFDSPWCFTNDGSGLSKEECSVDQCSENKRDFKAEAEALDRLMGGRGCECDNFFLHSLASNIGNMSTLPLFFAKGSCGTETTQCSLTAVVEKHCRCNVGALRGTVKLFSPAIDSTARWADPIRAGQIRAANASVITLVHAANASVMPHAHGFLASHSVAAKLKGPDVSAAKFASDCNSACFSSACSNCGHCIVKCQQGPHVGCKVDSEKELWFAMCGQATEDQLLAGIKQCGDPVPTGCAER